MIHFNYLEAMHLVIKIFIPILKIIITMKYFCERLRKNYPQEYYTLFYKKNFVN